MAPSTFDAQEFDENEFNDAIAVENQVAFSPRQALMSPTQFFRSSSSVDNSNRSDTADNSDEGRVVGVMAKTDDLGGKLDDLGQRRRIVLRRKTEPT